MKTAAKTVIGYARVSTSMQAVDGLSLAAQRARIEAWAASHGSTLNPDAIHVDAGISGKRADNRPALQAALDAVCQARGVLVVYSLSRLARSVRDTISIAERLDRAGADLVSLSERIDTTSASGKMVFRMLAVLNEFERDLVSERVKAVVNHKRALGQRTGQIPLGWRLGADGRTLETEPPEQAILAEIRGMRASGLTLRAIADRLNQAGTPTKNHRPAWCHASVAKILKQGTNDHEQANDSQAGPDRTANGLLPAPGDPRGNGGDVVHRGPAWRRSIRGKCRGSCRGSGA